MTSGRQWNDVEFALSTSRKLSNQLEMSMKFHIHGTPFREVRSVLLEQDVLLSGL